MWRLAGAAHVVRGVEQSGGSVHVACCAGWITCHTRGYAEAALDALLGAGEAREPLDVLQAEVRVDSGKRAAAKMRKAGRLPACLHGLAGNGVWLLSLDLKEVERAVRDLGPLSPGTCTCRSDLSLVAHQAAHRPPSSQQSDLVHNASLYALAMGFCTLEAAVPHPGMSGLRQSHTAAAAAAAGQCSGILSGCSLLFYLRPPCTTAVVLSTSHLACPAVQPRLVHVNAATRAVENISFLHCPPERRVQVDVPVRVVGEDACPGIKQGGFPSILRKKLPIFSRGDSIPGHIEVDITGLKIGQRITLPQMQPLAGVEIASQDYITPVVKITGSRRLETAAE